VYDRLALGTLLVATLTMLPGSTSLAHAYDPTLSRWTQQDPVGGSLGDLNSANRYVYAGDDPVNAVDPGGKDFGQSLDRFFSCISGGINAYTRAIIGTGLLAGIGAAIATGLSAGALGSVFAGITAGLGAFLIGYCHGQVQHRGGEMDVWL
jgi:hypothetical protein